MFIWSCSMAQSQPLKEESLSLPPHSCMGRRKKNFSISTSFSSLSFLYPLFSRVWGNFLYHHRSPLRLLPTTSPPSLCHFSTSLYHAFSILSLLYLSLLIPLSHLSPLLLHEWKRIFLMHVKKFLPPPLSPPLSIACACSSHTCTPLSLALASMPPLSRISPYPLAFSLS